MATHKTDMIRMHCNFVRIDAFSFSLCSCRTSVCPWLGVREGEAHLRFLDVAAVQVVVEEGYVPHPQPGCVESGAKTMFQTPL